MFVVSNAVCLCYSRTPPPAGPVSARNPTEDRALATGAGGAAPQPAARHADLPAVP